MLAETDDGMKALLVDVQDELQARATTKEGTFDRSLDVMILIYLRACGTMVQTQYGFPF